MKTPEQNKIGNKQATRKLSLGLRIRQLAIISMALAVTALPITGQSAPLNISNVPLFLQNAVQPNIFFMVDDSGSMGWEVLKTSRAIQFHSGYPTSGNIDITPDNTAERLELCLSYSVLAFNPNPSINYPPWKGYDNAGNLYQDMAGQTTVRRNPYNPGAGTINIAPTNAIAYFPWTDANSDGEYNVGECGANISSNNSDGITFASLSASEKDRYANWYTYYRKRDYVMKAALSEVIFNSQDRMGLSTIQRNNGVGIPIQDVDNITLPLNTTADTNKRALFQEMGNIRPSSGTPLRRKLQDVGDYYRGTSNSPLFGSTYNHTGTFTSRSPILNAANGGECQQNFAILMTDGFWNGGNPSPRVYNVDTVNATRTALFEGSDLYRDRDSNVRDTLGDVAMYYYDRDLAPALADQVEVTAGTDINPRQHMVTYTVAFGIKGEIGKTFAGLDPTVGIFPRWPNPFSGTTTQRNERKIDDVWHAAFNSRGLFLNASDPQGLIDSIQTAINDIGTRTGSAAGVSVTSGTVSSTTRIYQTKFESNTWAGHLLAYKFDPATNSIINADDFGPTGSKVNDVYKIIENQGGPASRTTIGGTGRTIMTYNGTKGVPFKWPSTAASPSVNEMSATQVAAIVNGAVTGGGSPDYALGGNRIDYLRGDHSKEANQGGAFRNRDLDPTVAVIDPFVLGDTVHSSPLYVGAPPFAYPDYMEGAGNEYYKFRIANFDRTPIIYFGANDGMLHGVNANTGEEEIAYVPGMVFNKLSALTSPNYNHEYYVDESPAVGDVFYGGAWRTTLIGALRGGGQGIFALDITDPTKFLETTPNPANTVLWEFTDADDRDLGFTFGRPSIARMQNGRWYAIFGNGYNNTEADGNASTSGNAVLYIVDIETKAVTKIDTGVGSTATPNGLARPAIVDYDGDYKVDYIYAGDLRGNMWKFDVTSTNPNTWRQNSKKSILFTAVDSGGTAQPITVEPEIDLAPNGPKGLFIVFGTGQYIEPGDITTTQTQTMYGIWDQTGYSGGPTVNVARNDLVTQTLTTSVDKGFDIRENTNILIAKWGNGGATGEYMGWKIDLPETGERTIANPVIQDDKVIFISITPTDKPCEPGGNSWFMAFNVDNGGRTDDQVIDVNDDGVIDDADKTSGALKVTSGVRKGTMILNNDISLMDDAVVTGGTSTGQKCSSAASSRLITSDSKGNIGGKSLSRPEDAFRQGWRQIQ